MAEFEYGELKEMVDRWLEANRRAQDAGDWRPMADLFTEDATYGWNMGPHEEFMAVGREEIRDYALGMEMGGLDGWTYPYQKVLIDEHQGEVIGLWKQVADAKRPTVRRTRSRASEGAGSAMRATSSGRGNATSSTSATPRPCSSR